MTQGPQAASTFRAFVAIELPERVRALLTGLLEELRRRDRQASARWVRPEGVHLTLQFLGETPESQLGALDEALASVAGWHRRFTLHLGALRSFPGGNRGARVLWAGVGGEVEALAAVQRDLATALVGLGFLPEEREFTPHLTLGRVPRGRLDAAILFHGIAWPPSGMPEIEASGLTLMQSTLHPEGARYTRRLFLPFQ